jgi:hypothetical protein
LVLSPDFPHVGAPLDVCATPLPLSAIVAGALLALLATDTLPVTLPAAVGANVTFSVAVCPGVSVVLALTPLALNLPPGVLTPNIVTFEFPLFVNVTPSGLLLPTLTFPKLRLAGFAPSRTVAATPVPLSEIPCGEFGALLTIDTEPVTLPTAAGANITLKVLLFPGAIVSGADKPLRLNPLPVALTCETVRLALPPFESVKVCELLVPLGTLPKLALAGVTANCGWTPVPLNVIVAGELVALLTTDILSLALPAEVGAKVTFSDAV